MSHVYAFPPQKASDECPAVPHDVSVVAPDLFTATKKLAKALKDDPKLEKDHPEFTTDEAEKKPTPSTFGKRKGSASDEA